MATIINIEEYRKKKAKEELEKRIIKSAFGLWESEEERILYYTSEQCEKDEHTITFIVLRLTINKEIFHPLIFQNL